MSELDDLLGVSGMGDADDELLDLDVSGLDPYEVGALAIKKLNQTRALVRANPAQAAQLINAQRQREREKLGALATTSKLPTQPMGISSIREFPLGIPVGGTREITITPKAHVRIVSLTVSDGSCDSFDIEDIQVNRKSVMLSGDPVPADRFKSVAERPPFQAERVTAGVPLSLMVTNISGELAHFRAVFDCIEL